MDVSRPKAKRPTMGWREWLALPELGIDRIKAKIDTGARTSSLHAYQLEFLTRRGKPMVRFEIHPQVGDDDNKVLVTLPLVEHRLVRSSNGMAEKRPVIRTRVHWGGLDWPIEITLANRDDMGFRMLLGRLALRRRVVIDPAKSFLGEKLAPPAE